MQNHKASNVKTKKSKTIIEVKPKIYPQRRKKKVTMVPMQNQNPADFANRIGRKFEVKTKHPSATAEKETTSLSDLNQKNRRLKPMYRERNQR